MNEDRKLAETVQLWDARQALAKLLGILDDHTEELAQLACVWMDGDVIRHAHGYAWELCVDGTTIGHIYTDSGDPFEANFLIGLDPQGLCLLLQKLLGDINTEYMIAGRARRPGEPGDAPRTARIRSIREILDACE